MSEAARRAQELLESEGVARLLEDVERLNGSVQVPTKREFDTGANRNAADHKHDYEGFLSIAALREYGAYMHGHRHTADGTFRDSDNWQKGIPLDVYMKSLLRHVFDVWDLHRGGAPVNPDNGEPVTAPEALCGVLFNAFGYLHEALKADE